MLAQVELSAISVVILELQQPMDFLTIVLAAMVALLALALFLTVGPFRLVRTSSTSSSSTFAGEESSRHQGCVMGAYTEDTQIHTAENDDVQHLNGDVQHVFMVSGAKTAHADQHCYHLRGKQLSLIHI